MTTALFRQGGEMFFDSNGAPLAGGQLFYYQANTTLPATTYADAAGSIPNPNPLQLNASGRLIVPVYFGGAYAYKELLTDAVNYPSPGATVSPWPFDNLPAAQGAPPPLTGFERLYLPWVSLSAAASPVTLAAAAAGTGYECDCTSGSITIDLPPAATSGLNGTGFFFKRIAGPVTNKLTIAPNGADNLEFANAALSTASNGAIVYIVSDGAQWLIINDYSFMPYVLGEVATPSAPGTGNIQLYGYTGDFLASQNSSGIQRIYGKAPTVQRFLTAGSITYTPTPGTVRARGKIGAAGAGGGAATTNAGTAGGDTVLGDWIAKGGNPGAAGGTATGGTGGTGSTNGTGTLIDRNPGSDGGHGSGGLSLGGGGGASAFGGAPPPTMTTGAGVAAKANSGSGGSGGSTGGAGGGGGGGGEEVEFEIENPTVMAGTVGAKGIGGAAGSAVGGDGADGKIVITEYYS